MINGVVTGNTDNEWNQITTHYSNYGNLDVEYLTNDMLRVQKNSICETCKKQNYMNSEFLAFLNPLVNQSYLKQNVKKLIKNEFKSKKTFMLSDEDSNNIIANDHDFLHGYDHIECLSSFDKKIKNYTALRNMLEDFKEFDLSLKEEKVRKFKFKIHNPKEKLCKCYDCIRMRVQKEFQKKDGKKNISSKAPEVSKRKGISKNKTTSIANNQNISETNIKNINNYNKKTKRRALSKSKLKIE